ncbi:hypothetical protein K402DRAFT_435694 [Aulographum hederae CBS 113979]|uniref:Zinc-binding loop region of homing endonuclease domain-containing protein n=1 Tax=Aulographum hederae CBS 113979 TaxID=1176131 RepID=A0A6G1GSF8_9PEZI|nr:hypothetical protein K402DRAFT_435694 [Aulographum hederae CBS 113979]
MSEHEIRVLARATVLKSSRKPAHLAFVNDTNNHSSEAWIKTTSYAVGTPNHKGQCEGRQQTIGAVDKKHILYYDTPEKVKKSLTNFCKNTQARVERKINGCSLREAPPKSLNISTSVSFTTNMGTQRVYTPYIAAAGIVKDTLTEDQRRGLVEEKWHASHLCSNSTCCNDDHCFIEPAHICRSRRECFNGRRQCVHNPPCIIGNSFNKDELHNVGRNEPSVEDNHNLEGTQSAVTRPERSDPVNVGSAPVIGPQVVLSELEQLKLVGRSSRIETAIKKTERLRASLKKPESKLRFKPKMLKKSEPHPVLSFLLEKHFPLRRRAPIREPSG